MKRLGFYAERDFKLFGKVICAETAKYKNTILKISR